MLTQPGRKLLLSHIWQLPPCFLFSGGSRTNARAWQPVVSVSRCIQASCSPQEAEISSNWWILEPQTSFPEGASVHIAEGIWGLSRKELPCEGPRKSASWILAKESCSCFLPVAWRSELLLYDVLTCLTGWWPQSRPKRPLREGGTLLTWPRLVLLFPEHDVLFLLTSCFLHAVSVSLSWWNKNLPPAIFAALKTPALTLLLLPHWALMLNLWWVLPVLCDHLHYKTGVRPLLETSAGKGGLKHGPYSFKEFKLLEFI